MKTVIGCSVGLVSLSLLLVSCSPKGWAMDYGKPAAQFEEGDVAVKGKGFVGKKVTVKGIVEKVDLTDPQAAWVHLSGGVRCNLGDFRAMAGGMKAGEEVYMDGFLKSCEEANVVLDPAMSRDPTAKFDPLD
ncbi:MAG: hypothetical protein ACPG4K_06190 [Haloferula sp.]